MATFNSWTGHRLSTLVLSISSSVLDQLMEGLRTIVPAMVDVEHTHTHIYIYIILYIYLFI